VDLHSLRIGRVPSRPVGRSHAVLRTLVRLASRRAVSWFSYLQSTRLEVWFECHLLFRGWLSCSRGFATPRLFRRSGSRPSSIPSSESCERGAPFFGLVVVQVWLLFGTAAGSSSLTNRLEVPPSWECRSPSPLSKAECSVLLHSSSLRYFPFLRLSLDPFV